MSEPARRAVHGVVEAFDEGEGLGVLRIDDSRVVSFHSTQLTDGTRKVAIGTPVTAEVVPWHRGRHEAICVTVA